MNIVEKTNVMSRGNNYRVNGHVVVIPKSDRLKWNELRDISRNLSPITRKDLTGKHVKKAYYDFRSKSVVVETPDGRFYKYKTPYNFVQVCKQYGVARVEILG